MIPKAEREVEDASQGSGRGHGFDAPAVGGLVSAPFENVDFRRNGVSFLTGQHTGVIQP